MEIVMAANAGTSFFGIVVFIGFVLFVTGIADGGNSGLIGLGLMVIGISGILISS